MNNVFIWNVVPLFSLKQSILPSKPFQLSLGFTKNDAHNLVYTFPRFFHLVVRNILLLVSMAPVT